jgi:ADP-ribose pyrophosphatase
VKLPGNIATVEIIATRNMTPKETDAYLSLYGLTVQNRYADGRQSTPYRYESVLRKHLDAVVLVLVTTMDGEPNVCLRTCIRPPLLMRKQLHLPQNDERSYFALLELPAGLVETDDIGEKGLRRRASAEALEETGYRLKPSEFSRLGAAPFNTPGVMAERCFFLKACIEDNRNRITPKGDGSPVEEGGDIVWLPLTAAIAMCDRGEILDMKTELGLRRLAGNLV